MKDKTAKVGVSIIGLIIFAGFLYGVFWVGKTISYNVFYKDMVQKTVTEMVKPEYLK